MSSLPSPLRNPDTLDSPALLVYPDRVRTNIQMALQYVGGQTARLRPHIKTHKTAAVMRLMCEAGIDRVKCATPTEAEMAAREGVRDVLLAYQPVLPKAKRLLDLAGRYPQTDFACLIDNQASAAMLGAIFAAAGRSIRVFLDLNIGQHRTGLRPEAAPALWAFCKNTPGIEPVGLHAYDGHIRTSDLAQRIREVDAGFEAVNRLAADIGEPLTLVASGTPTFPAHARRPDVECSPGTFVFWDWGYDHILPDEPFEWAAILFTRVVSILDDRTLCLDLGHKGVASENPIDKRVFFPAIPEVQFLSHSEEHLVVAVADTSIHQVGEVWYGIPYHICPTVALYEALAVVENGEISGFWTVSARGRGASR